MNFKAATRHISRTPGALLRDPRGFSLVELIVVMAIFIIVIMATSNAFNTLLTNALQQTKAAESQTGGIIGLEMMRLDLEHAGYGLPWTFQLSTINYTEAAEAPANELNDAGTTTKVPRAVHTGEGKGGGGSDRLVIRSTLAGMNTTAKKWTYAAYSSIGSSLKTWETTEDLVAGEKIIVVRATNVDGVQGKELVMKPDGEFSTTYPPAADFNPKAQSDLYLVYGVHPVDSSISLRMPFNRVDYYLDTPDPVPQSCAPNTLTLYKGIVRHKDGKIDRYPLLDCVADMQVTFGLDTNGDGEVDVHLNEASTSAQDIRDQVKEVRVYILAQEGKKDRSFSYPTQKVWVGMYDPLGREFDLASKIGADWQHYRWRLYTVVVNPKNLRN